MSQETPKREVMADLNGKGYIDIESGDEVGGVAAYVCEKV